MKPMLLFSFLFRCIRWHAWLRCAPGVLTAAALHAATATPTDRAPQVVRVGVYANAPKIFLSKDGQLTGILGDLLMAMAERERWRIKPVPCEWQACLQALQDGQIDLMPDVAFTDQRAQIFDFHSAPALLSW
jgi:ABC-type amino acid transport substrate-binding protein